MDLFKGLNESQQKAVRTTEGPVMVMAGAGSGKTKVLTTRISYIVHELGVNPYNILAVTFTNKATNEMKERIGKVLDIDTKHLWISTFHAFCVRVLRNEIEYLDGYSKGFQIIDEEDQLKIIKDLCVEYNIDSKPKELQRCISKEKNNTEFEIYNPNLKTDFNIISNYYEKYLKDNNLFDFDDLIIKTIELFKNNPKVLEKYQDKFQYILVDEFQDTNTLQYNLMFMLSIRYQNIFVVGDDYQSIYSFRGAKIENIKRFQNDFIAHKLIKLEKNYRSTTEILNLANDSIKHNPNQIKKTLVSNDKSGNKPIYFEAEYEPYELSYILSRIKKLHKEGIPYDEMAILYRSNYLSRLYENMLIKEKIPYVIYGGLSFFQRKEVKDILAYLRLITNYNDNFSFKRIINEPKRKIGDVTISKLETIALEQNTSLFNAIPYYEGSAKNNLIRFREMIESINSQIDNIKLSDLVDIIVKETLYEEELKKTYDHEEYIDRFNNIKELKTPLMDADNEYAGDNLEKLEAFLQDVSLMTNNDKTNPKDQIILSTYHQVKGLEFNTVFMVAMNEGIFPSDNCTTEKEIEEERRICYVGITRAKEHLYLTSSKNRTRFGYSDIYTTSMFIDEMNKKLYIHKTSEELIEKKEAKLREKRVIKPVIKKEEKKSDSPYKAGTKVRHKIFGDGIVISVVGDTITIAFPHPTGVRRLSLAYVELEII